MNSEQKVYMDRIKQIERSEKVRVNSFNHDVQKLRDIIFFYSFYYYFNIH